MSMNKKEAMDITKAFVELSASAFKGDAVAQQCVMSYHSWFKTISALSAIKVILGG